MTAVSDALIPYKGKRASSEQASDDIEMVIAVAINRVELTSRNYILNLTPRQFGNRTAVALLGGGVGAAIGAGVGAACSGPAAPGGAGLGALIGCGVGFTLAYLGIIYKGATDFKDWQKKQPDLLLTELTKILKDDERLEICLDETFNLDVMEEPVIDPCGHTFDLTNIRNHLKRKEKWEGDVSPVGHCPLSNLPLKEDDLRIDYLRMGQISSACKVVLLDKMGNIRISDVARKGLSCLQSDMQKRATRCFDMEHDQLHDLWKAKKIGMVPYTERLAFVAKQLQGLQGIPEKGDSKSNKS